MALTLNVLSFEEMRRTWNEHSAHTPQNVYENIWNDWCQKFDVSASDPNTLLLKKFIENKIQPSRKCVLSENGNHLTLYGLKGPRRYELHVLCDKLGLHHKSTGDGGSRLLHLYKPEPWLWEFSAKNPYSEAPEAYQKRYQQKQTRHRQRLARKECCECGANGLEAELFQSPYLDGYYCEDCLDTVSDGNGGVLGAHKFEPI